MSTDCRAMSLTSAPLNSKVSRSVRSDPCIVSNVCAAIAAPVWTSVKWPAQIARTGRSRAMRARRCIGCKAHPTPDSYEFEKQFTVEVLLGPSGQSRLHFKHLLNGQRGSRPRALLIRKLLSAGFRQSLEFRAGAPVPRPLLTRRPRRACQYSDSYGHFL